MKIKRLEITGFKSFKDKTVIHFDANITAVVGPNGCGKSNIVDALQWVMGEMSAKGLRGSSMEDVIFQGSQGYVPGGLAEVSLILENDGKFFPTKYLNYSEISITRRLHRSGESEYLIQQEPVRLKDIYEIFMDTGAGSRGFSLIEQGAISRLVTAKPEEMRVLIEEASGVTKFKARKKESQRKLAATEENLIRLNDIMTELKRQLTTLERQSQKASQYKKLQEKIEEQDLLICSREFLDFKKERSSIQSSLQDLGDQEIQFQSKMSENEKQKETKKLWQLECEKKIETQQQFIENLRDVIRQKENLIQDLGFQIQQSQKQEVLSSNMTSEAQNKKDSLQKDLHQLDSSYEALQKETVRIESLYQELNAKYEKNQAQIQENEKDLTQKQNELMKLHQDRAYLEAQIQSLKKQQEEYLMQEDQAQSLLKDFANQNREFTKTQKSVKDQLEKARQLHLDLTSDMKNFQDNRDSLLNTLKKQKDIIHRLKDLKNELTSRLSALEGLYKNFEGFQKGVKEVLMWKQQMKDPLPDQSSFAPVADIIDVPKKYELAVEAVLGNKLQALLANSMDDVFKALEFLKQNQCGRASFLNMPGQEQFSDVIQEDFMIGSLKDFISTDQKYHACINALLHKVAVVNVISLDLSIKYPDWTFVTLDGDVLFPSGIMTGGNHLDAGRLKLRREMKEMLEQKTDYEKQLMLEQIHLQKYEDRLHNLEKDFEQTQKDHIQQGMKIIESKKDLERVSKEVINSKDLLDKQNKEAHRLLTQRLSQEQRIQSLTKELEASTDQEKDLSSQIEKLTTNISMSHIHLDTLRNKVHQLQVDSTRRSQEAEGKNHQREIIQKQLDEVSYQINHIMEEKQRNVQVYTETQEKHKKEKSNLQELLSEQQKKQEEFSQIQNQYEVSRTEIEEIDKHLSVLRKDFGDVQSQKNNLSLTVNTLELKMKTLTETIKERYMLDLQDVAAKYEDEQKSADFSDFDLGEAQKKLDSLRTRLQKMGSVHLGAIEEYDEVNQRYLFLSQQKDDLMLAKDELGQVINKINRICDKRFKETYETVNLRFQKVFPVLFGGGEAFLSLVELKDKEDMGITITAKPPGKRLQNVSLLSGGEKALTAVSLIFAIFLVKPSPYCILDEVDAPLDDANVSRFNDLIKEMSKHAQVILVTHNKHTMEVCEKLYGVTMEEKGISKMVSVDMQ